MRIIDMSDPVSRIYVYVLILLAITLFSFSCGTPDNSVTGDVFTGDNITVINNNGDNNIVGNPDSGIFLSVSLSESRSGVIVMCRGVSEVRWTASCNNILTPSSGTISCVETGMEHDPCPSDGGTNKAEYCVENECQSQIMDH